ncbi:MAG TPA: serine/threonine-protein kinase, partial [Blastocatellia bacterium]|nr:serine/threonine-protein kinase [Blastocatellia bacterium]
MIGSVVGNYRLVQQIGEGGMGAVFKGIDLMLEREVAIKVLRPELARQPNIVERFRAEAVTLAKLNHPNIATLHSFFRQGDDYFMVMEFVKGETIDNLIRTHGAIAADRAITLFCQALDGIDHAHKLGIVHRDIKPANMMLADTGSIKVMDFGIARVLGTARMTREGHLIGTIEYMSPEQIRGHDTDTRSDIYSLGILLYEMLTGRVPFNNQSEYELMRSQIEVAPPPPRDLAPHISLPIEEAIMRSLAKRPEARFQTAADFRGSLLNSMRSATHPLNVQSVPGYAAPVTKASKPLTPSVPKETRMPNTPGSAPPVVQTAPPLSPTRVAQP